MHVYTSGELEKIEETYELESITGQCTFRYQLTEGEQGWVDFIGNRYAIAEYIADNTDEDGVVTMDVSEISDALTADGVDRAPCLSEDTQLQRLIWFIGPVEE
tara:strand:+ start:87 stop:395 length:309 start_codon:yes stop_codon:yes gene_type:complete